MRARRDPRCLRLRSAKSIAGRLSGRIRNMRRRRNTCWGPCHTLKSLAGGGSMAPTSTVCDSTSTSSPAPSRSSARIAGAHASTPNPGVRRKRALARRRRAPLGSDSPFLGVRLTKNHSIMGFRRAGRRNPIVTINRKFPLACSQIHFHWHFRPFPL